MKIYYAHHLWKYNTMIEKYEIDLIKQHFPNAEIINPNGAVLQGREVNEIMSDCLEKVLDCDILIFSAMDNVVSKGVVQEVTKAKENKKSIYFIKNNTLYDASSCDFTKINNSKSDRIYAFVINIR